MTPEAENSRRIQAVRTSCTLIEALAELDRAGPTELADRVGVSKTTAYHHLSTLEETGFVVREDGQFSLSLRFLDVGGGLRDKIDIYSAGEEELQALAMETGEYVNLVIEERGVGYIVEKCRGSQSATTSSHIGQSVPLHSTGAGKAILARLPEERVDAILSTYEFEERTSETLTSESALRRELETVRDRGYAVLTGEHFEGAGAVAAPVRHRATGVQAAVSVTGPLSWLLDGQSGNKYDRVSPELADQVVDTANRIEMRLDMSAE
ncbi:MAG: IclR family transcriptional regulator [Halolamina sp.]